MALPKRSRPASPRGPRADAAVDLSWALTRLRDWVLGPGLLALHVALFVAVTIGIVFWRLATSPDDFRLPVGLVLWGVIVLLHAGIVVTWGAVSSLRNPRGGPVYYRDIPESERTSRRRTTAESANPPVVRDSESQRPASWSNALAPVTPFPGPRATSGAPPAPGMRPLPPAAPDPEIPAPDLDEARAILASDQPPWKRWLNRNGAPAPGHAEPAGSAFLNPYPDSGSITQVDLPPSRVIPTGDWMARDADTTVAPSPARPPDAGSRPAVQMPDDHAETLPSLAAMLRARNMMTLSEAPLRSPDAPSAAAGETAPARGPAHRPAPARKPPGRTRDEDVDLPARLADALPTDKA